jgi:hypothetical protein
MMNIGDIPNYSLQKTPKNLFDENPLLYRLVVVKRALRAGFGCTEEDMVDCVTDMLTNLRHFCNALGIDYDERDVLAKDHFIAETEEAESIAEGGSL